MSASCDFYPASDGPLRLDLALQGGGAYGAFTWGVLDRLLDEPDISIEGISGTSAGAMNGAMLKCGHVQGGRAGAKALLARFWQSVGALGAVLTPFDPPAVDVGVHFDLAWREVVTRIWSPYQLNPFNINPLRWLLEQLIDLEALRDHDDPLRLFVTATNVNTGRPRVFECHNLSIDALLASASLPFLFQAVEIDGEPYWDGGYAGNPVLAPLVYKSRADDVLLVQINPVRRDGTPRTAADIVNRINEITFNASLIAELSAISLATELCQSLDAPDNPFCRLYLHMIGMPHPEAADWPGKMSLDLAFYERLHDLGFTAAEEWLSANKSAIGRQSTIDIRGDTLYIHGRHEAPMAVGLTVTPPQTGPLSPAGQTGAPH